MNNNKDCAAGFYGRLDRSGARGSWKRDLALAIGIAIAIGLAGMVVSARAHEPLRLAGMAPNASGIRQDAE